MRGKNHSVELAVYLNHDANITVFLGGEILHYLEIEKITQNRYQSFAVEPDKFIAQWKDWVMPYLTGFSVNTIHWNWVAPDQLRILKLFFADCQNWVHHTHHISHAWSVYNFTQPIEGDLVISVDGRGDLGDSFSVFEFGENCMTLVRDINLRLGVGYRMLGILSPEIESYRNFEFGNNQSVPGKAMALAGFGKVREDWISAIRDYYIRFREFAHPSLNIAKLQKEIGFSGIPIEREAGRDLLATSQKVFEELFLENTSDIIQSSTVKRILLTGGCALNVTLNSRISKLFNKVVFVSPAPNDCGISLGMFRSSQPFAPLINAYKGIPFREPKTRLAYKVDSKKADVGTLAHLLASGKIIGVVYDDCEVGPRALGHRSLLASPFFSGVKDKLNKIKRREFYRPVSPVVPLVILNELFEDSTPSPYMSFAPTVRSEYRGLLKEVVHIDGTARVQTVQESDGFIFELLMEFGKLAPLPVLANTSLNQKGKPLVNDFEAAMILLGDSEMDFLWINGLLYGRENISVLA